MSSGPLLFHRSLERSWRPWAFQESDEHPAAGTPSLLSTQLLSGAGQLLGTPISPSGEKGHGRGAYSQKDPLLKRGLAPVGHLASPDLPT